MKVVALVSGGKDSCYVMLKCLSYGHELIALAHISPPRKSGSDAANGSDVIAEPDSHMYQSVGTEVVPALARALGLPLYTRETTAVARVRSLYYHHKEENADEICNDEDEVEDLYALLLDVKAAHPDIQAVCAGALWSDYQRLRVENAAARAGLLSFAFLWRRDQRELIDEMIDAGVNAVVIKVAGIGLGSHCLGKPLSELRDHLFKLHDLYGSHVCGEGGEYETLVTSLPIFEHDFVIRHEDARVESHSDDSVAPVAYLDVKQLQVAPKHEGSRSFRFHRRIPPIPPSPQELQPVPGDLYIATTDNLHHAEDKKYASCNETQSDNEPSVSISSHTVDDYTYVIARSHRSGADGVSSALVALRNCISKTIKSSAPKFAHADPLREIVYVLMRLERLSGEDYLSANRAYSDVFGSADCTPPPARACVGMEGTGAAVTVEALVRRGRREDPNTVTLHVQSLSEWAPPCIGPYAQTVCDKNVLHMCGVLPLYPPTASIPENLGARAQTRAALYNMKRTLEATPGSFQDIHLFVAYVIAESIANAVEDEIRNVISVEFSEHFTGIIAIVPVHTLPKDAYVEIRAVGDITRRVAQSRLVEEDLEVSMRGPLRFELIELEAFDSLTHLGSVIASKIDSSRTLSVHVFVRKGALPSDVDHHVALSDDKQPSSIRHVLRTHGLRAVPMVALVDWLSHGAAAMCLASVISNP